MKNGLWRDHPCTPEQRRLLPFAQKSKSVSQADLLLAMLRDAHLKGTALELPRIMAAGIAQHGARFNELRARGFLIENELDRSSNGVVRSRYWLRHDPEQEGADGQ